MSLNIDDTDQVTIFRHQIGSAAALLDAHRAELAQALDRRDTARGYESHPDPMRRAIHAIEKALPWLADAVDFLGGDPDDYL